MRQSSSSLKQFLSAYRLQAGEDPVRADALASPADSPAGRLTSGPAGAQAHAFGGLSATGWEDTMPSELLPLPPPSPFVETISGLGMREVYEPELFRHFFGASASA